MGFNTERWQELEGILPPLMTQLESLGFNEQAARLKAAIQKRDGAKVVELMHESLLQLKGLFFIQIGTIEQILAQISTFKV